jgi:YD repeat-containing protein
MTQGLSLPVRCGERGSIVAITDDSGNVTQVEEYDAFGAPIPLTRDTFGTWGRCSDRKTC